MIDLEFNEVTKIYRIRQEAADTAGKGLRAAWRRKFGQTNDFVALDRVSFQVFRGDTLGIIGHNGAGKSTILKLLSNITTPTRGEIRIQGRIASLLEVGSGFHPELTGRENVYLSGSILGMRRSEITSKLEAIIDFAEVRAFIDVPVKRYSSGMFVRLGFAIAAHLEPDILLLDEVLAVGDATFQERCLNRIEDLRRAGTTIVFISHDLAAVQRLCGRVLLMQRGRLVFDGSAHEAVQTYLQSAQFHSPTWSPEETMIPARVTSADVFSADGRGGKAFRTGDELTVRVNFSVSAPLAGAVVSVCIFDSAHHLVCGFSTAPHKQAVCPGQYAVEFNCARLPMQPGVYRVGGAIEDLDSDREADWRHEIATIYVEHGGIATRGMVHVDHSWRLIDVDAVAHAGPVEMREG